MYSHSIKVSSLLEYQRSILGFVVLAVPWCNTGMANSKSSLLFLQAKYNYTAGQIWPTGQQLFLLLSLTWLIHVLYVVHPVCTNYETL